MGKTRAIPTTREMIQRVSEESKKEIAALKRQVTILKKKSAHDNDMLQRTVSVLKQGFNKLYGQYVVLNTENVALKAKCNKLEMNLQDIQVTKESDLFLAQWTKDFQEIPI